MTEKLKPKIGYIVVGWNNQKLLGQCFDSIKHQDYENKQIIFVDNASSDDSVEWTQKNYPEVTILPQKNNTGFAKGNNIGITAALKDPSIGFVALINSDATLSTDWTSKIIDFASAKPRGACFQGTTLDFYKNSVIDSTHIYLSRNGQGTQGNWRQHLLTELGPKKIFGVNAAACVVSRAFIDTQPFGVKLFDETLYMYLEDVDLAARATVMNWDNYLVPDARAYHMGSVSANARSSTFSLYMTFRNNSAVLFKNLKWSEIFKILPATIRGDLDTWRTLWRRHQKSRIWYVIKGRVIGLLRLPLFASKRVRMMRRREISSDYLWQLMKKGGF